MKKDKKPTLDSKHQIINYEPEKKTVERNYENVAKQYNDLNQLVHQLAVFHTKDMQIYKVNVIDYPGQRYECSGGRMSRWGSFNECILFNFTNEDDFNHFYDLYTQAYARPAKAEKIIAWLSESRMRLGFIDTDPSNDPQRKASGRI